jgi:hypothetical protein
MMTQAELDGVCAALGQADAAADPEALAAIAWRLYSELGTAQADASRRAVLLQIACAGPPPGSPPLAMPKAVRDALTYVQNWCRAAAAAIPAGGVS